MTPGSKVNQSSILWDPPLADREDLADQFPVEPKDWDAERETDQLQLSIKSAREALARGEVLPKPTFRDIPRELRDLRRMALYCHEYGFMTWVELTKMASMLSALGAKYTEPELKVLLKRYLWILIPEKTYAETIDGDLTYLFGPVFRYTFDLRGRSWYRPQTEVDTAQEIWEGLGEFWEALVERREEFLECLDEPGAKSLKEEFPKFSAFMRII